MINKYSRTFVENMVNAKMLSEDKLRDYDIVKDHVERGMSYQQLAIKYQLSRRYIITIVSKYKNK